MGSSDPEPPRRDPFGDNKIVLLDQSIRKEITTQLYSQFQINQFSEYSIALYPSVINQTDKNLRQHKKEFSDIQYESKNITKFRRISGLSLKQKGGHPMEPTENSQFMA